MNRLRQTVERVVRPVRATEYRKNRMREELLGHLEHLYNDELSRASDETQAMHAALTRFGSIQELTAELQQSVPAVERALWYRVPLGEWTRRRRGESSRQHFWRVLRWNVTYMALFIGLMTLAALVVPVLRQKQPRIGEPLVGPLLLFMSVVLAVYVVLVIAFPIGCEYLNIQWVRLRASQGAARGKPLISLLAIYAFLAALAGGGVGAAFLALPGYLHISDSYPAAFAGCVATAAILSVPLATIQAWQQAQAVRQFADWEGTDPETSV